MCLEDPFGLIALNGELLSNFADWVMTIYLQAAIYYARVAKLKSGISMS